MRKEQKKEKPYTLKNLLNECFIWVWVEKVL